MRVGENRGIEGVIPRFAVHDSHIGRLICYLTYTGLLEELEYLKIETRLIDEKFESVMGECVI
jgi:hypothetical protein